MQPKTILDIVRSEIRDFLYDSIEVVPGYLFNQYDTVKRCHLYINSKFEDQSFYQGRPKMFANINKSPRDVAAKFLNVDTKDIKVLNTAGDSDPFKVIIAQKELEEFLKEHDFAQKLNDMAETAATFGTVVLKKTKKGAEVVDLRRLFNDPTVANLQKSRFVTIKHLFTVTELLRKKEEGWDKDAIDKIVTWKKNELNSGTPGSSYEQDGQINVIRSTPYIEVYERFGEIEKGMLDGGQSDDIVRSLTIVVEPNASSMVSNPSSQGDPIQVWYGGTLFKSEWKGDYPFDEFHYEKTPGRWLGKGVVETLFIPQERMNEIVNQKRVSMELSAMHWFQTDSPTIVQNVLTDMQNGDLFINQNGSQITPVANEERNLAAFQSEEQYYQQLADRLSFVSDQAAGSSVPSSTPATNAVIQQNNVVSIFNFKRQNYANFIRRYMHKFVLPALLKSISQEHVLRFTGNYDDMGKLNRAVATSFANQKVKEQFLKGEMMTPQEYELLVNKNMQQLTSKNEMFLKVIRNWYSDIEFDFDILVDNEQQATDVLANNEWQVITAMLANPQGFDNPVVRTLMMQWAEKVGINPTKLENAASQMASQAPQGQVPQAQVQNPAQVPQSGNPLAQVGQQLAPMAQ